MEKRLEPSIQEYVLRIKKEEIANREPISHAPDFEGEMNAGIDEDEKRKEEEEIEAVREGKKEVETTPVFNITSNAKELKDVFEAIPKELTDVNLEILKDCVRIEKLDMAHVLLTELNIKKEAFDIFSVSREGKINITLSGLLRVLSCAAAEPIDLFFNDDSSPWLVVTYPESERTFRLRASEPEKSIFKKPDIQYNIKAEIDPKDLATIVKDAKKLKFDILCLKINSDIKTNSDNLVVSAEEDYGEVSNYEKKFGKIKNHHTTSPPEQTSNYTVDYLAEMITKKLGRATLEFSTDTPLSLTYRFGPNATSELSFLLAPKIMDD